MSSPIVLLVGHCGPDTSYLRSAVKKALPTAEVRSVHDEAGLAKEVAAGSAPLLLVNRVLEPGFATESGIELIPSLKSAYPAARILLVSNYPEAQEQAVRLGALPGFGKKDIGTPRLNTLLQASVATAAPLQSAPK